MYYTLLSQKVEGDFFMKQRRSQHIEVVSERSPAEFQDKLNALYEELQGQPFQQTLYNNENGFTAYLTYEVVEQIPETLRDEYKLKGITFTCGECPYYEAVNRYEGMCDFCKGTLRRTDEADCKAFWSYMEEQEEGKYMFEELRAEIKAQYGSMRKFADAVKVDNAYLSRMINGKSPFSDGMKLKILRQLGIEITEGNINKYFVE